MQNIKISFSFSLLKVNSTSLMFVKLVHKKPIKVIKPGEFICKFHVFQIYVLQKLPFTEGSLNNLIKQT
jgi:hypothetical protein